MPTIDQYRADRIRTVKFHEGEAKKGGFDVVPYLMPEERYLEYRMALKPVMAELEQLSAAIPGTTFCFCCCAQCAPSFQVWWTDGPSIAQVKPQFEKFPASPHYYASFVHYRSQPNDRDIIQSSFIIPCK